MLSGRLFERVAAVPLRRGDRHRAVAFDPAHACGKPRTGTCGAVPRRGARHQPDVGRPAAAFRPVSVDSVYAARDSGTCRAHGKGRRQNRARVAARVEFVCRPAVATVLQGGPRSRVPAAGDLSRTGVLVRSGYFGTVHIAVTRGDDPHRTGAGGGGLQPRLCGHGPQPSQRAPQGRTVRVGRNALCRRTGYAAVRTGAVRFSHSDPIGRAADDV